MKKLIIKTDIGEEFNADASYEDPAISITEVLSWIVTASKLGATHIKFIGDAEVTYGCPSDYSISMQALIQSEESDEDFRARITKARNLNLQAEQERLEYDKRIYLKH